MRAHSHSHQRCQSENDSTVHTHENPTFEPPKTMAFLEDPRLRQRWNQISHNAETVTENAAAGIWTFQHRYIHPCLACLGDSVEPCIAPCFGDRDERARRARARDREREYTRAEYTFDFYDDWDDDDELLASGGGGGGGILGGWAGASSRGEDWDRLIGGSGAAGAGGRKGAHAGEVADQPRRKRGMSYGTRGGRRKSGVIEEEDPTIIPSTAPLGFLGRLPWKIGGTLRYKPSAAFLQDHPGSHHPGEHQPLLLDSDGDDDMDMAAARAQYVPQTRKRSGTGGTGGSGDTSDSYRSRGDLFPSDGEGDEDAIPIDDEFAVALDRVDDRASSKGKRRADSRRASRTVSVTTLSSSTSRSSLLARRSPGEPQPQQQHLEDPVIHSIEHLHREEEAEAQRHEDQEVARKREAAAQLARERGLSQSQGERESQQQQHGSTENYYYTTGEAESRATEKRSAAMFRVQEVPEPNSPGPLATATAADESNNSEQPAEPTTMPASREESSPPPPRTTGEEAGQQQQQLPPPQGQTSPSTDDFIPARLPHFR